MPPANQPTLDLSPGSLIHIQGFSSPGYDPKNKFLIILGNHGQETVLAFRITSQAEYLNTYRARELVHIPAGTAKTLPKDCYIQCFNEVERLSVAELNAGFQKGKVMNRGNLRVFLVHIMAVVEVSDVLEPQDVADVTATIEHAMKNP